MIFVAEILYSDFFYGVYHIETVKYSIPVFYEYPVNPSGPGKRIDLRLADGRP